ncbi:MAG: MerR family DNA-binding transcriptional regulator [Deltaproteobacteria bacterium]|nr:MerR family DNA-binding transcriptional regulator [Deltaproteobacteria bacterium]
MPERPPKRATKSTKDTPVKAARNDTAGFVDAHRDARVAEQVFGISELAEELGTTTRAIRFYEEKGLLTPQRVGQNRVYTRRERARLQLILRGKSLGLTLRELQHYLDLYGKQGEGRRKQLELAIARSEQMIAELTERRAALDRTLDELELIRRVSRERLDALRAGEA